ncbi:hypothetical protein GGF37_002572 [Kickxella alabastrina]|nr:hypothetical protein GGF37_002572 [Kickxella alabastrina]
MRAISTIVSATALVAMQFDSSNMFASAACNFDKISVDTNPGFQITVNDDYKLLEDTIANVKYGLYCDSQPLDVKNVDKWFKVPIETAGTRVPIASGFLEALGLSDKLTAAELPTNLTNICLDTSKMKTLDKASGEINSDVDVIFSADAGSDGGSSARLPTDDKLAPLQKAEWIKFVAAFFNEEKAAESLFTSISDSYNCHRANLQYLKEPSHAYWVQYSDSTGANSYNIITSAYQKELLASAGATSNTKEAISDPSDVTKFQAAIKDADIVIDQSELTDYGQRVTEWYKNFGYTDPQNSGVNFLMQRQIYRTDGYTSKSGISNFPEFGYVRPDLVLQDIISVLERTYNPDYTPRWLLWLGGTNENTDIIGEDNYKCGSSRWLSTVNKCTSRTDFDGTTPSDDTTDDSEDKEDDKNDDSKNDNDKSSSGSGRAGKIAGGVIAGIAFIGLSFVGVHYFNKHRRHVRLRALSQGEYGDNIGLREAGRFN